MGEIHVLYARGSERRSDPDLEPRDYAGSPPRPRRRAESERSIWAGAARWWFEALDSRRVGSGHDGWNAQVVGVHEARPHLWIQIESADGLRRAVIHVTLETPLQDALWAIAQSPCDSTALTYIDVPRMKRPPRGA